MMKVVKLYPIIIMISLIWTHFGITAGGSNGNENIIDEIVSDPKDDFISDPDGGYFIENMGQIENEEIWMFIGNMCRLVHLQFVPTPLPGISPP